MWLLKKGYQELPQKLWQDKHPFFNLQTTFCCLLNLDLELIAQRVQSHITV